MVRSDTQANKASILKRLRDKGSAFRVEPFVTFFVTEWHTDPVSVRSRIESACLGSKLIVRSAWRSEDHYRQSLPGQFLSLPDLVNGDWQKIQEAINRVVDSYKIAGPLLPTQDSVIVQRQLVNSRLAGVAKLSQSRLYLHIDYDDISGRTDAVTSGRACRSLSLWRQAEIGQPWSNLLKAYDDVERVLGNGDWMLEFAIDNCDTVSLFQARKLKSAPVAAEIISEAEKVLENSIAMLPVGGLLSDMADWNPAEMLGSRPRPLAVSLYQALVTNEAWLRARVSLGYRQVKPHHLMCVVAAKPYIDVRRSCLSLIPRGVPSKLAHRIATDRLAVLRNEGHLHDRVETGLFFTCGDVTETPRTRELLGRGFSARDVAIYESELTTLTAHIVKSERHIGEIDAKLIQGLSDWYAKNKPVNDDLREQLGFLQVAIVRCRDHGVIPFARQARLAFIAHDLFGRLVELGVVSKTWANIWWRGLNSIANQVADSVRALGLGQMRRERFDALYGHLRARSYDIRCLPYSALEFPVATEQSDVAHCKMPDWTVFNKSVFRTALARSGTCLEPNDFFAFVRRTTLAREETKFGFTRVLSNLLEELARIGGKLGFSRDDLSYLDVGDLKVHKYMKPSEISLSWRNVIIERKLMWDACSHLQLSDIIRSPEDLIYVQDVLPRPSFITERSVVAQSLVLEPTSSAMREQVRGKIVVTEAAEPGMDWLFAYGVVGLITRYGGRNSHMATRCAEFQLPAAIGCGAGIMERLARGGLVRLDCTAKTIELITRSHDM